MANNGSQSSDRETKRIERIVDENGLPPERDDDAADVDPWEFGETPPTITVNDGIAAKLYHGTGGMKCFVELPDGSYGQVSIEPDTYGRTLRGRLIQRVRRIWWAIRGEGEESQ